MDIAQTNGVLRWLRTLAAVGPGPKPPDQELLRRFVADRDEAAFAALLQKHGPMVLGLCRRVLGDGPDAEDAFQATFIVLAQKAASIRNRQSVSPWLYGVAGRLARNLRRKNARSRQQECTILEPVAPPTTEVTRREVRAALDDELAKLPERLRLPLILCYLDGKTRNEAAAELGASVTTLAGRLERGRDLLRNRLTRRGITLSAALLASMLAQYTPAAVPTLLLDCTLNACLAAALGKPLTSLVSARIIALFLGELQAMLLHKVVHAFAIVFAVGLVATGIATATGALLNDGGGENNATVQKAAESPPVPENQAISALGIDHDYFAQGTWGRSLGPDEVQEDADGYLPNAYVLQGASGKDLPKGTKVIFFVRSTKLERLVGKERKPIKPEEFWRGFRSTVAIESAQVENVRKDGSTWWIEPKKLLILKDHPDLDPRAVFGAKLLTPAASDDDLKKLLVDRHNAALWEMGAISDQIKIGKITVISKDFVGPVRRYTEAKLDLTNDSTQRVAICKRYVNVMENIEEECRDQWRWGKVAPEDMARVTQARLEAQILLLKEQRRGK